MMRCAGLLLCLSALYGGTAIAQGEAPETLADDAVQETPTPMAVSTPRGDIITLISGKKLRGVQVLRKTPTTIEVEIMEGLEPLILKRKHVTHIEYDDIDLLEQRRRPSRKGDSIGPNVIVAIKVTPEFLGKITAPLSIEPLRFDNRDCIEVLTELSKKAGVGFEADDKVKQMPPLQRLWSVEITPTTTLDSLVQTEFHKAFPSLQVRYEVDKLRLMTVEPPTPTLPGEPQAPPPDVQ